MVGFIGEAIRGVWSINVRDLAAQDIGILNSWEIVLEIRPSNALKITDEPGELIPDADPDGIQRTLSFNREGKVRSIKISVDVTHTFISDLLISLEDPSGKEVTLHERTGGSSDNLLTTFTSNNLPALDDFKGQNAQGPWTLTAKDLVARDTGKLNTWSIEIELEQESPT